MTAGCQQSTGPAPAKPGSIAHTWAITNEAWASGDYKRANDNLARLAVSKTEYAEKAKMWSFVLSAGVANGYREAADAYETAARASAGPTASDYRKRMAEARRAANQAAMSYVENLHEFMSENKDPKIVMPVAFPAGSSSEPMQLAKLKTGMTLSAADCEMFEKAMLERGVVLMATSIAGSRNQFAEPPRDTALRAMAQSLFDVADLYCPRKLDEPRRMHVMCKEALEALALMQQPTAGKEVEAKVRELMKKHPLKAS